MKLDHENVIPLLGTTNDYGDFPAMVFPWVENGSLTSYIECHNNDLTPQRRFGIVSAFLNVVSTFLSDGNADLRCRFGIAVP